VTSRGNEAGRWDAEGRGPRFIGAPVPHVGYVLSGRIRVVMDDGTEEEFGPDDAVAIPPGHDAWTVGDEPCIMLDSRGPMSTLREQGLGTDRGCAG
jgi:uncharacterized cupin superfamily protein